MITEDLIAYIQAQIRKNIPKELISSRLSKAGWHADDIVEGLRKVAPPTIPPPVQRVEYVAPKPAQPEFVVAQAPEISAPAPARAPIVAPTPVLVEEPEYVIKNPGPFTYTIPKPKQVLEPVVVEKPVPPPAPVTAPTPVVSEPAPKKIEEFIPTLIPKNQAPQTPAPEKAPILTPESTINSLPKGALISSYADDLSIASIVRNARPPDRPRSRSYKWIPITILILGVLGGVAYAFSSGMIPLIKQDTKVVLLRAPINFGMQASYKSQTKATLSLPSIANITTGLVSGEVVTSDDRDSISIRTEGMINQHGGVATSLAYHTTFKSTILKDSIVADIKYDGANSFLSVPELSLLLGPNAPMMESVSISKGKFGALAPILPPYFAHKITMIDIDKVLSKRIDPYASTETGLAFKEFISSSDVIERSPEMISLVPTYHYQINADRQATKKLVGALTNFFLSELPDEVIHEVADAVENITLDNFEVWIGKNDSNIYQYKLSLSIPLSKVIGLEDKGIAGNKVTLDWTTTFSEFNVVNNITMPQSPVSVDVFMKGIEDMKMKNEVVKLRSVTANLLNAEGSFGKQSNPSGSCIMPSPASLFSPTSHPKGAITAVGNIAGVMNTILMLSNDSGSCYSTPSAWAVAFPLPSDPTSFFCLDSHGYSQVTSAVLTDTTCK